MSLTTNGSTKSLSYSYATHSDNSLDNIRLFDPKDVNASSKILIIGLRACGKTVLAKKLLDCALKENKESFGVIIGPCETYLKEYGEDYKNTKAYYKFTNADYKLVKDKLEFVIIENGNFVDNLLLAKLMSKDILVIVVDQYPYGYPTEITSQLEYVFSFGNCNQKSSKKLYEKYYSSIGSFGHFMLNFDQCKDYTSFVVERDLSDDNDSDSDNDDIYYYYNTSHKFNSDKIDSLIKNQDSDEYDEYYQCDQYSREEYSSLCTLV
jgi:GTPase SAR1 family protein